MTPSPGSGCNCRQNSWFHFAAFVILFNLIFNMTCSERVAFWPSVHIPRVGVCGQDNCYHAAAFRYSRSIDMQHNHVLKKLIFDLLSPSPGSVVSASKIFATMCCIRDSLKFDMQHDHVLKSWILTYWPNPKGPWGVCGQNICYHAAAFVILFNLICTWPFS